MDPQQIKAFIDAMAASDLDEMEVSHGGWTLRLSRHSRGTGAAPSAPAAAPAPPTTPARLDTPRAEASPIEVAAPMFGVVHLQQAPGEPPFVKAGDVVEAGRTLFLIEAMKVFTEVRAEQAGRVSAVHVASGAEVEAGQALVVLEPLGHV